NRKRALQVRDAFIESSPRRQRDAEIGLRLGILGVDPDRRAQLFFSLAVLAPLEERARVVHACARVARPLPDGVEPDAIEALVITIPRVGHDREEDDDRDSDHCQAGLKGPPYDSHASAIDRFPQGGPFRAALAATLK